MKNMFENYDHNINAKLVFDPNFCAPQIKPLSTYNDAEPIIDKKGREIGVSVKHDSAFKLYFYLDARRGEDAYDKLMRCNEVYFCILNTQHDVILEKYMAFADIFNQAASELVIPVCQLETQECALERGSYKMQVSLLFGTSYINVFSESDGLLVVR